MLAAKTPWFAAGTQPARKGVYEVKPAMKGSGPRFQYWTGRTWRLRKSDPRYAFEMRKYPTNFQNPEWRGLADEAKVAA